MVTVGREDMSSTRPWADDIERKSESRACGHWVWPRGEGVLHNKGHVRLEENYEADTFAPWAPILPVYLAEM